jgi:hypothetical protein
LLVSALAYLSSVGLLLVWIRGASRVPTSKPGFANVDNFSWPSASSDSASLGGDPFSSAGRHHSMERKLQRSPYWEEL